MLRVFAVIVACLLSVSQLTARELVGVAVEENVVLGNGTKLTLNGAGIRSKFFFDIYIAALYLENNADSAEQVVNDLGAKRLQMHFLYEEVERKSLIEAWNEGFGGNLDPAALKNLQGRIDTFNSWFDTVREGEQIVLDYLPGTGTRVVINEVDKGVIAGKDFNDGLLSIWLGKTPVTKELKRNLLGKD